jgi:hypothetical protein
VTVTNGVIQFGCAFWVAETMSSQEAMKDVAEPGYRYPFAGGALRGTEYGEGASPAYAQRGASNIAAPAATPNHRILNGLSRVRASLFMTPPVAKISVAQRFQRYIP